jgi:hypothetical protein
MNMHTHTHMYMCVFVCVCNILVNSMGFDKLKKARCGSLKLPASIFPTTLL